MKTVIVCPTADSQDLKVTVGQGTELQGITELKVEMLPGELNKVTIRLAEVDLNVEGALYIVNEDGVRQAVDFIQLANGDKIY